MAALAKQKMKQKVNPKQEKGKNNGRKGFTYIGK